MFEIVIQFYHNILLFLELDIESVLSAAATGGHYRETVQIKYQMPLVKEATIQYSVQCDFLSLIS